MDKATKKAIGEAYIRRRLKREKGEVEMGYVYIKSEPCLWTVGFYLPNGKWEPESDWDNPEDAAARVHYLNGGE